MAGKFGCWIACSAWILMCCLSCSSNVEAVAVMSVDLGSEWVKIGIVSPGVPMEIVLNKESKRKTPVAVSFRDGERLIGDDAMTVAVRFPANAYLYFLDLLGKKIDNPMVQLYQKRFPYYNIVADEERGTVLFKHDSETYYSPEELLGMVLSKCKDYAHEYARQPVREAVITVPPYFNQAERRAVLNAAELADIKVLQLINTNTAGALNYGIFRRNDFNETAQHLLLYDMGASSTVATVISYQVVKSKDKGIVEKNPQLTILGVGYDRRLGGLEMQLRLRDYLGKAFNDMKKTKTDVFTNHRALAKLFKEAGRLKTVLSANADHFAQVEGLLDEQDFRFQVTREQFENLCGDLFDRVKNPIEQALNAAAITMDVIDQVILLGAGTRVPKVQEKLTNFVQRDLGKSLNTDEAAAMGAVYKAADLSTGFKVKKFLTKDAVIFPILVDFEREIESEDGSKTLKIVRRTLFSHMNPYPQKKILTFNKHVDDFTFYVSYGVLPVSPQEASAVGSSNITKVDLTGVAKALEKNTGEGVDAKGVKAHFNLDESGIFTLNLVESVFEKNSTDTAEEPEDTLSKLGSAFTKLFSGTPNEPIKLPEDLEQASEDTPNLQSEGEPSENGDKIKPVAPEAGSKGEEESKEPKEGESTDNSTSKDGAKDKVNATTTETKKPKVVVVKEPLDMTTHVLDVVSLDGEKFKVSSEKLKQLNEVDRLRNLREKSRNALESFVTDMQHKLYAEYDAIVSDDERENIGKTCTEISDWLYEDGSDAEKPVYDEKLKSVKLLTRDLLDRVREHKERPDALEALDKMLNISLGFLETSKVVPEDQQYFTEVELSTLDKLVKETLSWRNQQLEAQEQTPLSKAPVLTIRMLAEKIDSLDREVKYMLNKARVEKLKKQREAAKEKEKESENKTSSNGTSGDDVKSEKGAQQEIPPVQDSAENVVEPDDAGTEKKNASDKGKDTPTPSKPSQDDHTEL